MPNVTDIFKPATDLIRHVYGPSARIVDHPTRGVVGELDAKDTLEREDPKTGEIKTTALGVRRFNDLRFRLAVVKAAEDLAASGAQFSQHDRTDRANRKFWVMENALFEEDDEVIVDGKMMWLKQGARPSAALADIFENGGKYGFECATAMMVIYHKAILDTVGADAFDQLFARLGFYRWTMKDPHYLALEKITKSDELVPGCHYYYENPDASEENSAFRGENVIYLGKKGGERLFYAHGVVGREGTYIVTEDELLRSLRALRKRNSRVEPSRKKFRYELDANRLVKMAS